MNPLLDPNNPSNKMMQSSFDLLNGVNYSVQSFSRISQLMQMNFQSLHISFSSILQLVQRISLLRFELYSLFKTFAAVRFFYLVYLRLQRGMHQIVGSTTGG